LDIRETHTLNERVARDDADERHICPLQLDFIERVVRLWSNPGELVFTPFAGIGSEVHTAVRLGRRGLGIELKPSYWRTAVSNLRDLDEQMNLPSLFDEVGS
jgi:DNA modification methylase